MNIVHLVHVATDSTKRRLLVTRLSLLLLLLINAILVLPANAQSLTETLVAEDKAKLAEQARRDGNIVRGAILFHQGNINCAKCHRPVAESERIGPDLSRMEADATDEQIIESILEPSKLIKKGYETVVALTLDGRTIQGQVVRQDEQEIIIRDRQDADRVLTIAKEDLETIRPGEFSNMPSKLADELKNRQQFLDLLRYVLDLKERGPEAGAPTQQLEQRHTLSPELEGMVAIQKFNCTSCHQADSASFPVASKRAPNLKWSAQNLNPQYIQSFIANPHNTKPGTTMPEVWGELDEKDRKAAAVAITSFLIANSQSGANEYQTTAKIKLDAVSRGHELFNSVGCAACHSPREADASELKLDDSIVLGDISNKYGEDSLVAFLEDPLQVRPSGHMPDMQLTHREATDIGHFLLQNSSADASVKRSVLKPDRLLVEKGKLLFEQYNCAACHLEVGKELNRSTGKALKDLDVQRGCLSEEAGAWPKFMFVSGERDSIKATIKDFPTSLTNEQQIAIHLRQFNCIACHRRGDLGGVTTARNPHFETTNLNLGDQGRIPPTLTGVGAKLKPKWMRDVLVNGRAIRPYMKTRMPQYGEQNIELLLKLFDETDQLPATEFAKFTDQKETRKMGLELAGSNGLNCVACHTYQYKLSDTMPAVDLTEMTERLEKDWFYQYMLDPQKFSHNTVMPSFWPGGKAIRNDLEGSSEDQIEALWQYLIDGRQARAPRGVVLEPLEIVVANEAQMLRRSYPTIGKRGIGVGYPGGVNLAFDAEQLRLALIWRGKFIDPAGVWRGQGSGTARPMERPLEFAKGPELDQLETPWIVDSGRPPQHQFKGYSLDQLQRPTFKYEFDSIAVTDFFSEVIQEAPGKTYLRRTITFDSREARNDLRFRLAAGEKIGSEVKGLFKVEDKLMVRIVSEHNGEIEETEVGKQVEVWLELKADEQQKLVIEYQWE